MEKRMEKNLRVTVSVTSTTGLKARMMEKMKSCPTALARQKSSMSRQICLAQPEAVGGRR